MDEFRLDNDHLKAMQSLFPMPLTSIEKYHWLEDTEAHPNFIFGRLRFHEKLAPDLARQAWEFAARRQPIVYAAPQRQRSWLWEWTGGDQPADWPPPACGFRCLEDPAGLNVPAPVEPHAVGLVISRWSQPQDDGEGHQFSSQAHFFVHHAMADGVAALQVINDWLTVYANLSADRDPLDGIHPLDLSRLRHRNRLGLTRWRYLKHLPKQPIALFGAAKFVLRQTPPLVPGYQGRERGAPPGYPALLGRWLPSQATAGVYRQAQRLGITANAMLMGRLFLALAQWRREHSPAMTDRDWMRIILPISIRTLADRRLPATNRTSLVQVDRRLPLRSEEDSFFRMLDREIKIILGWQLDKMFLLVVRGLALSDSILKRAANSPASRGMAVFTDLGRPFRKPRRRSAIERNPDSATPDAQVSSAQELQPVAFELAGPIRPGTPANFSVARFDGRLRISLHYDRRVLSPQQAIELMDCYEAQLSRDD